MNELSRYGQRLRIVRERAGLSLREAAARACIDKNTLLKLERGGVVRESIRKKVCRAYGVMELDPDGPEETVYGEHFAMHLRQTEKWYRTKVRQVEEPSAISSSETIQNPSERVRQGTYGFANQFLMRLNSDRPSGRIRAAILEVFGDSGWASQASGEGFLYVIKGALLFEIGDEKCEVIEGASITFDRTIKHNHRPATGCSDLPVVLLYVQTD